MPAPLPNCPVSSTGSVSVQDGGAQLAAPWLLDGIRGRVLDACAAPGGKSGHLLELGNADIALTCVERDKTRLQGVRENLDRLGADATLIAADASTPKKWWDGQPFDAILLDAPCSATGCHPQAPGYQAVAPCVGHSVARGVATTAARQPLEHAGPRRAAPVRDVLGAGGGKRSRGGRVSRCDDGRKRERHVLQNNNIRDVMRRTTCGYQLLPGRQIWTAFILPVFKRRPEEE